ncbi:hypothetical protein B5C34_14415 [Pacificimonas flava]|uniref:2'-5' RNA ligase family protein n=3 Tax=Sphingosinicellaceae TaxID=2820280 RepID=A0A219B8Z1_9SPHN|nr:2'-5' RNA ligase family protein [Pacificimonas aurantium]OWV34807.1 hypothetical protein B5C34_14415 [Pacificimonas flava]
MERRAQGHFDRLRAAHFPPERNYLAAHITMFHHLPETREVELRRDLKDEARHERHIPVRVDRLRNLGKGVAYVLESPELLDFRDRLARRWEHDLVPQDAGRWQPHVTVQNKVSPEDARMLMAELEAGFSPWTFTVTGASLWFYRGGPWDKICDTAFRP